MTDTAHAAAAAAAAAAADPVPPAVAGAAGAEVWACVVCYHARADRLQPLVQRLRSQVQRVLLVDNAPQHAAGLDRLADPQVHHLPQPHNRGTAGALNAAWRAAQAAGVPCLVSFDQDSLPAPDLVPRLLATLRTLQAQGHRVAAVGPAWTDSRSGRPMRLLRPVHWRRRHVSADQAPVEVDHLISSGCLMAEAAYRAVGPYSEELFLDYVDIEWCLRARAQGLSVWVDPAAAMQHAIGERVVPVAGRSVAIHRPERNGLLLRNHLLLWRSPAARLGWLLADARQVVAKLVFSLLFAAPRGERLRALLRGLRDGLGGRGGGL